MSQHDGSRPPTAGVWEPAFPPVVLAQEEDGVTEYRILPGMTKLELATVQIMAGGCGLSSAQYLEVEVTQLAEAAAFMAEAALNAAAKRQRVALDVDERNDQLDHGTLPTRPRRSGPAPADPDLAKWVQDVRDYLGDTNQLEKFYTWCRTRAQSDVYDPAEAERMIRGNDTPTTREGG